MPALIVLGCIILFFVILFAIHINVRIAMKDDMTLSLRVLGIPIKILPQKEKTYNPRHYTLKKIRKRDAKSAKKAANKKASPKKKRWVEEVIKRRRLARKERRALRKQKKSSRPPVTEMIKLSLSVAKLFFSRFFGKLHIRVVKLHVRIGAKDAMTAAVIYGLANQSVQYTMEFLRKFCRVDKYSRSDIRIEPDFLIEDIAFDFDLNIRVTLGGMLGAVIKAGWKFLVGYEKIKPDPQNPKPTIKPPAVPTPDTPPCPDAPPCA